MKRPRRWWRWFVGFRRLGWRMFGSWRAMASLNRAREALENARTWMLISDDPSEDMVQIHNRMVDAERLVRACRAQLRGWNDMDKPEDVEDVRCSNRLRAEQEGKRGTP